MLLAFNAESTCWSSRVSAYHSLFLSIPAYFYSIKKDTLLVLTFRRPIISQSLTPPDASKFGCTKQFS